MVDALVRRRLLPGRGLGAARRPRPHLGRRDEHHPREPPSSDARHADRVPRTRLREHQLRQGRRTRSRGRRAPPRLRRGAAPGPRERITAARRAALADVAAEHRIRWRVGHADHRDRGRSRGGRDQRVRRRDRTRDRDHRRRV